MSEPAPQRESPLHEVFNGLRWVVRAGAPWCMLPNDLPPWEAIYQQTQRRTTTMASKRPSLLYELLRVAAGRKA